MKKNGGEGIEKRLLKGDQVKRGLGVPSPTPVEGDAAVPSPTPVKRVLGVPSRRLQGCPGGTPDGDVCTQSNNALCNNSQNSECDACDARACPGTGPGQPSIVYICGPSTGPSPLVSLDNCPSESPSESPSKQPSESPSPSKQPSDAPSKSPSKQPSDAPSKSPSKQPSDVPSKQPSDAPSESPSVSLQPSVSSQPSMVSYFYICNSMNPLLTCLYSLGLVLLYVVLF